MYRSEISGCIRNQLSCAPICHPEPVEVRAVEFFA